MELQQCDTPATFYLPTIYALLKFKQYILRTRISLHPLQAKVFISQKNYFPDYFNQSIKPVFLHKTNLLIVNSEKD